MRKRDPRSFEVELPAALACPSSFHLPSRGCGAPVLTVQTSPTSLSVASLSLPLLLAVAESSLHSRAHTSRSGPAGKPPFLKVS